MQFAAGTPQPSPRRAALVIAAATALFGSAAALHYTRLGLALAHYDARAHLVVARRVFDSLTPGWQQVGAVWLPLPHLLNAIPVQSDWLYRTGYSGIANSIASMTMAAWAIARLIQRATDSWIGGAAAAALLMLNPDVLYLQSTPMTEPLLFGTTFLAVALIAEWCQSIPNSTTPNSQAAGWSCIAAVLTRYEAFPVIAAAIGLAFVVLLRRGVSLGAAVRAVRGLAWWPLWALAAFLVNSKVTVGAFFVSGGFYVAENPALGHPWLAWTQIWEGLVRLAGPLVPWLAVVSAIGIVAAGSSRKRLGFRRKNSLILVLALAASAALPLYAYSQGHPVRIRYAVPLVAACAALIGTGVSLLPRRVQPIAAIAVVALSVWQVRPFDRKAPVVIESQREAPNMIGRRAVTSYLAAHWDGQPILMSMGSLAHYMHDLSAAGFGIRDFLHEGNGEIWKYAVAHPAPVAAWIAIEERAEGGDALNWQAKNDANFLRGYQRVADGGGVALYRRIRP
ncbi:MAG TPA: hypothetical protein VNR64_19580 [Vicinamibacterales bacterium]|nr:hypothetical protein [Vicinamibacterales bacterium]